MAGDYNVIPCPYGGTGIIVIQKGENGPIGRCSLSSSASRALNYTRPTIEKEMSSSGCPEPVGRGYTGRKCIYANGDWRDF